MKKLFIVLLLAVGVSANAQVQLVSGGSANAYTLTFPGVFTYTNGISVTFKASFSNTDTATININGKGAKSIKKQATSNLASGDIRSGQVVTLVYDGTNFQMTSPSGNSSGNGGAQTLSINNHTLSISGGNSIELPNDGGGVGAGDSAGWSLAGNAGTDTAINFIGTTDLKDVLFKVNNRQMGKLGTDGSVAFGIFNNFQYTNEGATVSGGYGNQSQGSYSAIGGGAGNIAANWYGTVSGGQGNYSSGFYSTILGGKFNVALSYGELAAGVFNYSPLSGNQEEFVSSDQLFSVGNGSAQDARSNALTLLKNGNMGLGTVTPGATLDINGTFRLQGNGAAAGRVLVSDSSGYGSWQTLGEGGGVSTAWDIAGNTAGGSDFLGTTNAEDLRFKVHGVHAGVIADNYNTAFGKDAYNTYASGGTSNTAFGGLALHSNTTGIQNTAIGYGAMQSNTVSPDNLAIGFNALNAYNGPLQGGANMAIGKKSLLLLNGFNVNNLAVGNNTLRSAVDNVLSNTVVGQQAMVFFTSGSQNNAIGNFAMFSSTSGNDNNAMGYHALDNNSGGNSNIAIGSSALANNTTGNNNIVLGFLAATNNSTGSDNTVIGSTANTASDALNNAAAIGSHAMVTDNNCMVLGSIGGVNDATDTIKVGIGTTTPTQRLHIVGGIRIEDGNQQDGYVLTSDANGVGHWGPGGGGGGGGGWGLTGNASTDSASNFIGTTDAQPLIFRTGDSTRMKLRQDGGLELYSINQNLFIGDNVGRNALGGGNTAIGQSALTHVMGGSSNIAIGNQTMYNYNGAAPNYNSIAIGNQALYNFNTNQEYGYGGNVAIGEQSMYSFGEDLSTQNVALGFYTMHDMLSGGNNTAIGDNSMRNATGGYVNTAVGSYTLVRNTTGQANSAFGVNALAANADGMGNTGLGYSALSNNTTGSHNVAIGSVALLMNVEGSNQVAIGDSALFSFAGTNSPGQSNVAIGKNTMALGTNSRSNVAIGENALMYTTAYSSIAIGNGAIKNALYSDGAIAIGYGALGKDPYAMGGVVAIGNLALANEISASPDNNSDNVAVGGASQLNTNSGTGNTSLGQSSMLLNTSGSNNTVVGNRALWTNSEGTGNTALGSQSLFYNNGSWNVAIGTDALASNTSGNLNTAIGYNANVADADFENATAIGANAIVGASNSLVLGNGANVGIGTSTPLYKLQVDGDIVAVTDGTSNLGSSSIRWDNVYAVNGTIQTSDARFKKNIQNLRYGLDDLLKLRPVTYQWKKNSDTTEQIGLIAQEVLKVIPEVVNIGSDSAKTLGMHYDKLVPVMINAMKEQQKQIEDQQKGMAELQQQIGELKKIIGAKTERVNK